MLMRARYAPAAGKDAPRPPGSAVEAVLALDGRDTHAITGVPAIAPDPLDLGVLCHRLPGPGRVVIGPIGDGDAAAVRSPHRLDAKVARLQRGELLHPVGRRGVAVTGLIATNGREHDGDVWRRRGCGEHG